MRLETVAAETPEPQKISETSSIHLVETSARHLSIVASSTEASRPQQRSMIAVMKPTPSAWA